MAQMSSFMDEFSKHDPEFGELVNTIRAKARETGALDQKTKTLITLALGAAGGIECVAAVLELDRGFVHGSLNCEDLHPELEAYADRIPHESVDLDDLSVIAKASFGFGDVNGCVIFRKYD